MQLSSWSTKIIVPPVHASLGLALGNRIAVPPSVCWLDLFHDVDPDACRVEQAKSTLPEGFIPQREAECRPLVVALERVSIIGLPRRVCWRGLPRSSSRAKPDPIRTPQTGPSLAK